MIGGYVNMKTKHIALYGLFLAIAVVANYIEHLIPLPFIFPGVKLGLANSVGLIVLYYLGRKSYAFFGILRVLLSAILFTGFGSTFMIALGGTIVATVFTILVCSITKASIFGISATGAVFHGLGQVLVVSVLYGTIQMMWYMLVLVISGAITGVLMAIVTSLLIRKLPERLIA